MRRSGATRDHITQAAVMLFALKGITATSMDDVCLAAGCSKGGLYHHFKSKQALVGTAIRQLEASDALLPPLPSGEDENLPGAKGMGRVLIELWAAAAKHPELREQLATAYRERRRLLGDGDVTLQLVELLQIGRLIELATREGIADPAEAARRLGISQAA